MEDKPEIRYDRTYGDATFAGSVSDFFEKPLEEQVRIMGWSHACPVIDDVVKAYGDEWRQTHPGGTEDEVLRAGMEKTLARYAECNFMFGLIAEAAKDTNPALYDQLRRAVPRLPNEPPGKVDAKHVPKSFQAEMSPLSTPWGYALPRVLIEEMGRGEKRIDRTPARMMKALELIDAIVPMCKTPIELIVKLSEEVANDKADPKMVLYHLLSDDILKEENCSTLFKEVIDEIEHTAPTLSALYKSMSFKDRKDLGIVDF